jgi:hypothetical protein
MPRCAGEATYAYLEGLLSREEARRQSLSTRAAVVLSAATATGALVLAALSWAEDSGTALSAWERGWMATTVISVAVAALLCLWVLAPQPQELPRLDHVGEYLRDEDFDEEYEFALQPLAEALYSELTGVSKANDRSAPLLTGAFTALTIASIAIFFCIALLL